MDDQAGQGDATNRSDRERLDELLVASAGLLEGLPDAVVAASPDGRIVFVNALAESLFGYARSELVGRPVQTLWPERLRERYTGNMELYFATRHPLRFTTEAWGRRRDGSEFIGEMSWGIVQSTAGPLLLAVGRDISQRRAIEIRLRAAAAMGERALEGSDPVTLAIEAVELVGTKLPIAGAEVRMADGSILASFGAGADPTVRLPIGAGGELTVAPERDLADDELSQLRVVADTLAAALTRLRDDERIRHEAFHDPLTGLANRTLLRDRLDHALARSAREGVTTGVLFVDLDNFKRVNDAYGHATGDAVLVELATRLRDAVRPGDTIARLGGDEFVVVCEEIDEEAALAVGRRLQSAIAVPIAFGRNRHLMSASIGIALGRSGADRLLGNADAAAYMAKAAGPGEISVAR